VHVPVYHPHAPRTGDHTPHSRLWASGAGLAANGTIGQGHVCDIAPTVLALLDVAAPAGLDGRALLDRTKFRGAPAMAAAPLA
jgi:arylsulfatase A-like enzyme